jgi:hypothetical protein
MVFRLIIEAQRNCVGMSEHESNNAENISARGVAPTGWNRTTLHFITRTSDFRFRRAVAILVIRNSRYPRKAFPDEARERGIVVRVASAIVDIAKAPEFWKWQRRVDFPEFVGVFGNEAIDKDLPVPRSRIADVLDMKPNVGGAIAKQLVIPLRSPVEFVGAFDVIEEEGSGSFRGRRNQVIEM